MLTGFVESARKVGLSFPRVSLSQTPVTPHEHVSGSGQPSQAPGAARET